MKKNAPQLSRPIMSEGSQELVLERFNNLIRADFKGTKLIGYTSRFSHTYGLSKEYALCQTEIGAPLEKLPYEDAMRQAYAYKMKEMDNPDLKLF